MNTQLPAGGESRRAVKRGHGTVLALSRAAMRTGVPRGPIEGISIYISVDVSWSLDVAGMDDPADRYPAKQDGTHPSSGYLGDA